jgi:hypothetical protein
MKNLECITPIAKSPTSETHGSKPIMMADANSLVLMITNPALGSLENKISSKIGSPLDS